MNVDYKTEKKNNNDRYDESGVEKRSQVVWK